MDPATTVAAVSAGLSLVEALLPRLKELAQSGEITPEQQATLKERFESLRTRSAGQFEGPEWQVRPNP